MNAKIILFFLFLFCTDNYSLIGQNASIEFIIGAQNLNYLTFDGNRSHRTQYSGELASRIGFNFYKRVSSKLGIQTGLHFNNQAEKNDKISPLNYGSEFDPVTGMIINDPSLPNELQLFYDHWYFEIPANFRIDFNDKKIKPFIESGLSTQFYWKSKTKIVTDLYTDTSKLERVDDIKSMSVLINLSFGLSYDLNDKYALLFQPYFKLDLFGQRSVFSKEHRLIYGLQIGLSRFILPSS